MSSYKRYLNFEGGPAKKRRALQTLDGNGNVSTSGNRHNLSQATVKTKFCGEISSEKEVLYKVAQSQCKLKPKKHQGAGDFKLKKCVVDLVDIGPIATNYFNLIKIFSSSDSPTERYFRGFSSVGAVPELEKSTCSTRKRRFINRKKCFCEKVQIGAETYISDKDHRNEISTGKCEISYNSFKESKKCKNAGHVVDNEHPINPYKNKQMVNCCRLCSIVSPRSRDKSSQLSTLGSYSAENCVRSPMTFNVYSICNEDSKCKIYSKNDNVVKPLSLVNTSKEICFNEHSQITSSKRNIDSSTLNTVKLYSLISEHQVNSNKKENLISCKQNLEGNKGQKRNRSVKRGGNLHLIPEVERNSVETNKILRKAREKYPLVVFKTAKVLLKKIEISKMKEGMISRGNISHLVDMSLSNTQECNLALTCTIHATRIPCAYCKTLDKLQNGELEVSKTSKVLERGNLRFLSSRSISAKGTPLADLMQYFKKPGDGNSCSVQSSENNSFKFVAHTSSLEKCAQYGNTRSRRIPLHSSNNDSTTVRHVNPFEFIAAVKYGILNALDKPWELLGVAGPPVCCRIEHTVLPLLEKSKHLNEILHTYFKEELWVPALKHFNLMFSAGILPDAEAVQKILLFIADGADAKEVSLAVRILDRLFFLYPPCCLHTGLYYNAVFTCRSQADHPRSGGVMLTLLQYLQSKKDNWNNVAKALSLVFNVLASDLAGWLHRYQLKDFSACSREKPLVDYALNDGQSLKNYIHEVQGLARVCVQLFKNNGNSSTEHQTFMDIIRLLAEVFRSQDMSIRQQYLFFGPLCKLLAGEIAAEINTSGLQGEHAGQFLYILKPSWLSMLTGQILLEIIQGPLRTSVIETMASYIFESKNLPDAESTTEGNCIMKQSAARCLNIRKANKRDYKGEVQLHRCCRRGDIATVRMLLAVPGLNVNVRDNAGWTPLHEAASHGHSECVLALFAYIPKDGGYLVDTNAKADCGTTPLMTAAINGKAEICRILLEFSGVSLLEPLMDGNEVKTELQQRIPEEIKSLLKNAKFAYRNVVGMCVGVPLSVSLWNQMAPLFAPILTNLLDAYHVDFIRDLVDKVPHTGKPIVRFVTSDTIRELRRGFNDFEKLKRVVVYIKRQPQGLNPALNDLLLIT